MWKANGRTTDDGRLAMTKAHMAYDQVSLKGNQFNTKVDYILGVDRDWIEYKDRQLWVEIAPWRRHGGTCKFGFEFYWDVKHLFYNHVTTS